MALATIPPDPPASTTATMGIRYKAVISDNSLRQLAILSDVVSVCYKWGFVHCLRGAS